jgi:hypothetical protein
MTCIASIVLALMLFGFGSLFFLLVPQSEVISGEQEGPPIAVTVESIPGETPGE